MGKILLPAILMATCLPAFISVGPALAGEIKETCWLYHHETTDNTLDLCRVGKTAMIEIFFPNHGHGGTTICRAKGEFLISPADAAVVIRFGPGRCENGRTLEPTRLTCSLEEDQSLDCTDQFGHRLRFRHKKSAL